MRQLQWKYGAAQYEVTSPVGSGWRPFVLRLHRLAASCMWCDVFVQFHTQADTRRYRMAQGSGMSGLSEDEAKGFHRMFMVSFALFIAVAAVAHYAAWQWRPWIPGVGGYTASTPITAPAVVATK